MKDKIKFNVEDEVDTLPDFENTEDVSDEIENIEVVQSDDEEEFYASEQKYNELREAMEDTDFRLYLINNDLVIPGTLEGNEIQFLDLVGSEDNEEFVMKPAPKTLKELLKFKTLYNTSNAEEITDEDEVTEAPHEKIVEYILNLKLIDDDAEDVEDDEKEIDAKEKEEDDDESNEQE